MRLIDIDNITALDIMHNVICDKEVAHKMLDFLQSQQTIHQQGIDKEGLIDFLNKESAKWSELLDNGWEDCVGAKSAIRSVLDWINQQPTVEQVPLSEIYRVIAGHSDYHGDNILAALTCIAAGQRLFEEWFVEKLIKAGYKATVNPEVYEENKQTAEKEKPPYKYHGVTIKERE